MVKLNAQQLRTVDEEEIKEQLQAIKRRPIFFILENIYDTYNVGGLFRLADALAIEKMYLCGEMEIPPNPKIKKASIGTYKVVPWEYKTSAKAAIEELRRLDCHPVAVDCHPEAADRHPEAADRHPEAVDRHPDEAQDATYNINVRESFASVNLAASEVEDAKTYNSINNTRPDENQEPQNDLKIIAVEQDDTSRPYTDISYNTPIALLFGNETYGVLPETLKLVDEVAEIPMWGINKSLNVIVSAAIVSYWAANEIKS